MGSEVKWSASTVHKSRVGFCRPACLAREFKTSWRGNGHEYTRALQAAMVPGPFEADWSCVHCYGCGSLVAGPDFCRIHEGIAECPDRLWSLTRQAVQYVSTLGGLMDGEVPDEGLVWMMRQPPDPLADGSVLARYAHEVRTLWMPGEDYE
jgi:hypothetical protein